MVDANTKKILVIGGLSELGKTIVRKLVEKDYFVKFTITDESKLDESLEDLRKYCTDSNINPNTQLCRPSFLNMSNLKNLDRDFQEIMKVNNTQMETCFDYVIVTRDEVKQGASERKHTTLHPEFTDGVLAPYLLIRKLLDFRDLIDGGRREMRLVFVISQPASEADFKTNGFDDFFAKSIWRKSNWFGTMRKRADLGLAIIAEHIRSYETNVKVVIVNVNEWNNNKTVPDALCDQISEEFGSDKYSNYKLPTRPNNRRQEFFDYITAKTIECIKTYSLSIKVVEKKAEESSQ